MVKGRCAGELSQYPRWNMVLIDTDSWSGCHWEILSMIGKNYKRALRCWSQ